MITLLSLAVEAAQVEVLAAVVLAAQVVCGQQLLQLAAAEVLSPLCCLLLVHPTQSLSGPEGHLVDLVATTALIARLTQLPLLAEGLVGTRLLGTPEALAAAGWVLPVTQAAQVRPIKVTQVEQALLMALAAAAAQMPQVQMVQSLSEGLVALVWL